MRRPFPATIIASVALFFSLAGTGIATAGTSPNYRTWVSGNGWLTKREARRAIRHFETAPGIKGIRIWHCHRVASFAMWCGVTLMDYTEVTACQDHRCWPVGFKFFEGPFVIRRGHTLYCKTDMIPRQRCGRIPQS